MSSRRLAVVTGASSGSGLEIAELAAQDGYDLLVADAETAKIHRAQAEPGRGRS